MATQVPSTSKKRRSGNSGRPERHCVYAGYRGKLDGVEWPPGFRSQTCNPLSPHSMVKQSAVKASQASTSTRDRLSEAGNWAAVGFLGALSDRPQKITSHKKSSEMMMRRPA